MYDAVVIGSGLSGSVCALKCVQYGLKVLLIEKMNSLGGSSALSTLKIAVCGSMMQENANIKDSEDIFLQDIERVAGGMNQRNLTRRVVKQSKEALQFLIDNGAEFKDEVVLQDGHSLPRTVVPKNGSPSILNPLHEKILSSKNCDVLLKHKAIDLKIDMDDKAVVVIKNLDTQEIYEIKPNLAVVFASGGYSNDENFRSLQNPLTSKIKSKTSVGANADSLKILIKVGAVTTLLCQMRYAFDFPIEIVKYSVIVDRKNATRFVREDSERQELAFAVLTKMNEDDSESFPLAIFDTNGIDSFYDSGIFENLISRNLIKKFDSLSELSVFYRLNFQKLQDNVNFYNKSVNSGKDNEFAKDIDEFHIKPIKQPPFYAIEAVPLLNYTQGGVAIDENARVLGLEYKALADIYAIGEASGGVNGESRLISTSSTECVVFGLIAAKDIAGKRYEI